MRALSLHQPWATLVVLGAKRIETRHWQPPSWLVGQPLAIHAAKTTMHAPLAARPAFRRALGERSLPYGALVGTVCLDHVSPITPSLVNELVLDNPDELEFGNYDTASERRYAWHLSDPRPLAEPIPYRGHQNVFQVADDLLGDLSVNPEQGTLL